MDKATNEAQGLALLRDIFLREVEAPLRGASRQEISAVRILEYTRQGVIIQE